jgi:hypothetical protein
MHARTIDNAGHCALHFEFDLNEDEPNDGRAAFSIPVEPWALASLGRLVEELHQNPCGEFRWTPTQGSVTT